MKKFLFVLLVVSFGNFINAQEIATVKYVNEADIKVFVVNYENEADLKVYIVDY
jgi:hypothetical protein